MVAQLAAQGEAQSQPDRQQRRKDALALLVLTVLAERLQDHGLEILGQRFHGEILGNALENSVDLADKVHKASYAVCAFDTTLIGISEAFLLPEVLGIEQLLLERNPDRTFQKLKGISGSSDN